MGEDENGMLGQAEAERQNKEALKSGKEALKKQSKKNAKNKMLKVIIKAIIAKLQLVLLFVILSTMIVTIITSIIVALFGGDTSDKKNLSEYGLTDSSRGMSLQLYLRQFSHSGEAPQTDDKLYYKLYGDGVGWPTIGNADLQWKSHQDKFDCAGKVLKDGSQYTVSSVKDYVNGFLTRGATATYTNAEVDAMNVYIERELVDSVGDTVSNNAYQYVLNNTEGIDLSEQQLYALTAIVYNFGHLPTRNGYTFKGVYEAATALYAINSPEHNMFVWDNWWSALGGGSPGHIPSRDASFETYVKGVFDFSTSDAGPLFGRLYYIYYTQEQLNQFSYAPNKPITRTPENEKEIFTYLKNIYGSVKAGDLISGAESIHTKYEKEKWTYSIQGLYYNNIEATIKHPKKITCCATFVGESLYVSGLLSKDEMNAYGYNSAPGTYNYLLTLEGRFEKVSKYEDLQAGDIIFTTSGSKSGIGHTQIYAGDQTWYNAGSTSAIQRDSPYVDKTWAKGRFIVALRPL